MAAAAKSSYIQLYDEESKHDDYKFQIENKQAKLLFKDHDQSRDMEFEAGAYKFKFGTDLASTFDLKVRFDDVEADVASLQADQGVANNAANIAQEIVDRTAGDTALQNQITAEINSRTTAVQAVQDALDVQEAKQAQDDVDQASALAAEASSRAAGITAEETRAVAAEAALQSQITNILSNTDPASLDSLSEILSHINSEDATLAASIASLQSQVTALQAKVDELTNS